MADVWIILHIAFLCHTFLIMIMYYAIHCFCKIKHKKYTWIHVMNHLFFFLLWGHPGSVSHNATSISNFPFPPLLMIWSHPPPYPTLPPTSWRDGSCSSFLDPPTLLPPHRPFMTTQVLEDQSGRSYASSSFNGCGKNQEVSLATLDAAEALLPHGGITNTELTFRHQPVKVRLQRF